MRKNQISIFLARLSFLAAIISACLLMLSWMGNYLMENPGDTKGLFVLAFCLAGMAVMAGSVSIHRLSEGGHKRIAWLGTIAGLILFVPTGVVVVILLIAMLTRGVVY